MHTHCFFSVWRKYLFLEALIPVCLHPLILFFSSSLSPDHLLLLVCRLLSRHPQRSAPLCQRPALPPQIKRRPALPPKTELLARQPVKSLHLHAQQRPLAQLPPLRPKSLRVCAHKCIGYCSDDFFLSMALCSRYQPHILCVLASKTDSKPGEEKKPGALKTSAGRTLLLSHSFEMTSVHFVQDYDVYYYVCKLLFGQIILK